MKIPFISALFEQTSTGTEPMPILDDVNAAVAKIDAFVSKEAAAEAEIILLKQQLSDAQAQAVVDAANIKTLLDKIATIPA